MATNISTFRPIDLGAILDSQQPVIDLRLKEFEQTTRKFVKAVSEYTNRAIEEINQRKAKHAQETKRLEERKSQAESEITTCKVKEIKLMEDLEREQAERLDAEAAVAEMKRQLTTLREKIVSMDVEIEQCQSEVDSHRKDKGKDLAILVKEQARVSREVMDCEESLQCAIGGIGAVDETLLRFLHIDPQDPEREFNLVLNSSSRILKVTMCHPPIPTLPLLVERLNSTRDLQSFVREARAHFVQMVADGNQ